MLIHFNGERTIRSYDLKHKGHFRIILYGSRSASMICVSKLLLGVVSVSSVCRRQVVQYLHVLTKH